MSIICYFKITTNMLSLSRRQRIIYIFPEVTQLASANPWLNSSPQLQIQCSQPTPSSAHSCLVPRPHSPVPCAHTNIPESPVLGRKLSRHVDDGFLVGLLCKCEGFFNSIPLMQGVLVLQLFYRLKANKVLVTPVARNL